jgi:hypothetical protein
MGPESDRLKVSLAGLGSSAAYAQEGREPGEPIEAQAGPR